jgi:hypothetical protein
MVRNVFLNIEILLNDGVQSLGEQDVQAFAFLYFGSAPSSGVTQEVL